MTNDRSTTAGRPVPDAPPQLRELAVRLVAEIRRTAFPQETTDWCDREKAEVVAEKYLAALANGFEHALTARAVPDAPPALSTCQYERLDIEDVKCRWLCRTHNRFFARGEECPEREATSDAPPALRELLVKWQSTPWPLVAVLRRLADAADHLLRVHDCDAQGWEGIGVARDKAREIADGLEGALAGAVAPLPQPTPELEAFSEGFWAGRMSDRANPTSDERERAYRAFQAGERWSRGDGNMAPLQHRAGAAAPLPSAALEQAAIDLQFLAGSLRLRVTGDPAKLTAAHALAWHRELGQLADIAEKYGQRALKAFEGGAAAPLRHEQEQTEPDQERQE